MIGQHFLSGMLAGHGVPAYPGQMPPGSAPQHHAMPSTNPAAQPTFIYQEFKCTDCEFRALNQADVELHRRSMHRNTHLSRTGGGAAAAGGPYVITNPALAQNVDTKPDLLSLDPVPSQKKSSNKRKSFLCLMCDAGFGQKAHLETHVSAVHNNERPYTCTTCSYICANKDKLDRHVRLVHNKERPFSCHLCDKRFGQKFHLERHMAAIHMKERPYACSECAYTAATKGMVQKHVQAVHRKEKPFECEICQTRFSQKSHMQKHVMTVHMKEKPYKCKECSFQTATYATLNKHISVVHKPQPYQGQQYHQQGPSGIQGQQQQQQQQQQFGAICSICNMAFPNLFHRNQHVREAHCTEDANQKCFKCQSTFATRENMWRHLITKHMASGYSCEACGKKFTCEGDLSRHKKLRASAGRCLNQSNHICDNCGKSFSNAGNLSRHRKLRGAAGRCLRGSGKSKGSRRGAEPAGRVPLYNGQGRQIGWKEVYGKHNMEKYHPYPNTQVPI